ncbi:hypothetical protein [Neobacillus ginsengisoli]|uniref:Uncharacterized protein n=1 Tax=Neobacillus ginsengisoli TaxID=904295 RepID=A0ABT9XYV6_9BACI|nr:hypothetical protein [Neobacillus ginsengisoli]MDQ0200764.1 hypothetical protein [Neobacillus ginsengisoli]
MDHIEPGTPEADSIVVDMAVVGSIGLALYLMDNHQIQYFFSSLNDLHVNLSWYITSLCNFCLCGLVWIPIFTMGMN